MKMRKGLSALAILLALTVVACNEAPKENSSNASTSGQQQTTSAQPSIKVTAADNKKTLEIGGEVQLTADVEGVTWESADAKVATVDAAGKVTAVAPGTVKISAKKDGYKAGEISITVTKPAAPHPAEPTWPAECPALIDTSAWTAGTPAANSYGKNYTPLTAVDGSVGVKIAMGDYNPEGASFDADGKLPTEATSYVKFNVKAPKAGVYQMVMCGRVSDDSYMLGKRGITITVNGQAVNIEGDNRDGGLNGTGDNEFVIAPSVQLTGNEDTITVACRYYRIAFALSTYVTFAEH